MSSTTFIELDSNGNIIAASDWKFSAKSIESKEPVLRAYNGKLYRYSQLPEPSLSELRQQKLAAAKAKIETVLYTAYPAHKQLNLSIYGTAEARQAFRTFKITQVAKYDQLVSAIRNCQNFQELVHIDINNFFDA